VGNPGEEPVDPFGVRREDWREEEYLCRGDRTMFSVKCFGCRITRPASWAKQRPASQETPQRPDAPTSGQEPGHSIQCAEPRDWHTDHTGEAASFCRFENCPSHNDASLRGAKQTKEYPVLSGEGPKTKYSPKRARIASRLGGYGEDFFNALQVNK
jgi:hypothetical protein